MATTTTPTTTPTTQTSGSGGGIINILNTGANAVITVGCCGDSGSGAGSGATDDALMEKPSTEDCAGGKLIVLETGDASSTLATSYGTESTLKSKLSGGSHVLQFAICGGPKGVALTNGVENAAMNANVQYEAEYTDGTSSFSGDFMTGAFCLLRSKVTSDQAFVIRLTVYNSGCDNADTSCSNGIINITSGTLTGDATYGTQFTVTTEQGITEFEVCAGEKKFSALSMIGIPTDIMIDGASVGTTMPTLPFCATTIKVTGAAGVNATILDETCTAGEGDFTGHWWNGVTGSGERHWYLTQAGKNITGNHTSQDIWGTVYAFSIVSCTVSATNPFLATGVMQQTFPAGGGVTAIGFQLNEEMTELYYSNQIYTKVSE